MFGFIINIIGVVTSLIQLVYAATMIKMISHGAKIFSCPLACGGMAWFITGMVLRWRHIGKVCSAEYVDDPTGLQGFYMVKSGNFIQIYLIVMLCLPFALCCLGCCALAVMAKTGSGDINVN